MTKWRKGSILKGGLLILTVLLIIGLSIAGSGLMWQNHHTREQQLPRYAIHQYENMASDSGRSGHRVLVSGSGLPHMSVIDYDGQVLWTVPTSEFQCMELNDADVFPNGQISMAVRGASESAVYLISPDYKKGTGYEILWTHRIPKGAENHTAQALPDGGVLISYASADRLVIVELDAQGNVRKMLGDDTRLPGFEYPAASSHMQVRQIHKTAAGTYTIARFDGQKTVELDENGKLLRQFPSVGGFTAIENGRDQVLVSGGDSHTLTLLSKETRKPVWTIGEHDIPGVTLGFAASVQILPNGHIILANWGGHGGAAGDSVMEIDPETKKIIWSLNVGPAVSNVQVLDHILTDDVLKAVDAPAKESHSDQFRSPHDIVSSEFNGLVYVADHTNRTVQILRSATDRLIGEISVPDDPNALALSADGYVLYVAMGGAQGQVAAFDTRTNQPVGCISVGHTPSALALSEDGRALYVANRFNGTVQAIALNDQGTLEQAEISAPIRATREPIAMVYVGDRLYVGGHLPNGNMTDQHVSSEIVVMNGDLTVDCVLTLANGSTDLKDMAVSPDGAYIYVTHTLGRYNVATTQADRGWIYNNAVSEIRTSDHIVTATMLLDDIDHGAGNPWGVAVSQKTLYVSLSGTRELMMIDREGMRAKIDGILSGKHIQAGFLENADDIATDLTFLHDFKERVDLGQDGPHGIALVGNKVYLANYYAGNVTVYDGRLKKAQIVALNTSKVETMERGGERLWNDATIGFQHWQSCASCHPDARADALNWDNMNDGIGTPKQARTMVDSWYRGRVMATGIRANAQVAVRAGLRYIMFNAAFPESDFEKMDAYVKSLTPEESPYLVNGKLSESAQRGQELFNGRAQCAACHNGKLYGNDKLIYANYTQSSLETRGMLVPPLREVWRTAPYLHDGSASTILDVLTTRNLSGTHGHVSDLSEQELLDLCEYVLSIGTIGDGVNPNPDPDQNPETNLPSETIDPDETGTTIPETESNAETETSSKKISNRVLVTTWIISGSILVAVVVVWIIWVILKKGRKPHV